MSYCEVPSINYCMVCAYIKEDYPRAVHTHNHNMIFLLHLHACALCTCRDIWCKTFEYHSKMHWYGLKNKCKNMTKAFYVKIFSVICLTWAYFAPFAVLTIWTCAPRNPTLGFYTRPICFSEEKNPPGKTKQKQSKNKINQQRTPMLHSFIIIYDKFWLYPYFDVCVFGCLCPDVSSSWCHWLVICDVAFPFQIHLLFECFAGADPGFLEKGYV